MRMGYEWDPAGGIVLLHEALGILNRVRGFTVFQNGSVP